MTADRSLLLSEDAEDLQASVRSMLDRHCAWSDVLARTESPETGTGVWKRLVDLGCTGLAVSVEHGGLGASWAEVAVVCEELGALVADVPYLPSAVVATAVVEFLGLADLAEGLAAGDRVAALAHPWPRPLETPDVDRVSLRDDLLHGEIPLVAGVELADVLLVPVGDALFAVDTADVVVERATSLDETRPLLDLRLAGVTGRRLAAGPEVAAALARAGHVAVAMLAAEQLGVAQRSLDMSVEYASQRKQFGRAIGSFQANQHRLADLWVQIVQARAVTRYAAGCAATDDDDLPVAAALAQVVASRAAQHATQLLIQVHGGIGFTWEHPAHLYLKRARADAIALGTEAWHHRRLGQILESV